jgi:hypothetical protein
MTEGLLEKSKLAQHAYEENHNMCMKEAKVMQIELNTTYRKCSHSISQSNWGISSIWTYIIAG